MMSACTGLSLYTKEEWIILRDTDTTSTVGMYYSITASNNIKYASNTRGVRAWYGKCRARDAHTPIRGRCYVTYGKTNMSETT